MQLFVGQELKVKDYARATMYYLKGETICNNYDAKKYKNMIQTMRNTVATEKDKVNKKLYIDTLIAAYDRAEQKGFFNVAEASIRGLYILQSSVPNREKADSLFTVAFAANNTFKDAQLSYYYYNLYTMYTKAKDDLNRSTRKESYQITLDFRERLKMKGLRQERRNQ